MSRTGFDGSKVDVQMSTIEQKDLFPVVGQVIRHRVVTIPKDGAISVWVRTPAHPFAVTPIVESKFEPAQVNPEGSSDTRTLGAKITYSWSLTKRQ
jgi:hypothetical protein